MFFGSLFLMPSGIPLMTNFRVHSVRRVKEWKSICIARSVFCISRKCRMSVVFIVMLLLDEDFAEILVRFKSGVCKFKELLYAKSLR